MSTAASTLDSPGARTAGGAVWTDRHADTSRIKLSWVLRLRWAAALGQSVAIVSAHAITSIHLPLVALFTVVGIEIAGNLGLEAWQRRTDRVGDGAIAGALLFDAVVLTALLSLSGGYSNPFATLYLVNVALAAVLLDAAWAWATLGASLLLFAGLFLLEHFGLMQVLSTLDQEEIAALHVQGMWVAFVVASAFIVAIVQQVRLAMESVQGALAAERSLSARKDKVASLATLAAGAAHELSTPLSTIAVVVKELQRSAEKEEASAETREDLGLIRQQVARCRDILHHMSAQAGENAGEPFVVLLLSAWLDEVLQHLPTRARVRVAAEVDLSVYAVEGPRRGLARALRGLLKNALQASPSETDVRLAFAVAAGRVRVEVVDQGCGMAEDVLSRAGEPFFTTKTPGEGMGLGLFLTQTLAEQLGGALELRSVPGRGTTATLDLPLAHVRAGGGAP